MTREVESVENGENIRKYFLDPQGLKHQKKWNFFCVKVQLKGKLLPVRIMNVYRGSRSTAPLLLNLDIKTGVLSTSRSSRCTPEV